MTALYSCDDHLDLYAVPRDVWESRLSGAEAEHGPRVVERDGKPFWVCEDRVLGRSGMGKSALATLAPAWGLHQLLDIDDAQARDDLARCSVTAAERPTMKASSCPLPSLAPRLTVMFSDQSPSPRLSREPPTRTDAFRNASRAVG